MRVIGITGGVGAGKSTVLDYVRQRWDTLVVQADVTGHEVMAPGGPCYEPILELFGSEILREDKSIDRGKVAAIVFQDGGEAGCSQWNCPSRCQERNSGTD